MTTHGIFLKSSLSFPIPTTIILGISIHMGFHCFVDTDNMIILCLSLRVPLQSIKWQSLYVM